ncbi:MAG: hypothetical protein ACK5UJ_05475 [Pseudobdellovibrionaceae bacterium]|jgi:hypothetical protein
MRSQSQKDSPVLALGLLVCAALLYFLGLSQHEVNHYDLSSESQVEEISSDEVVNKHLFMTDQKLQLEALKMKQQNSFQAPEFQGNTSAPRPDQFLPQGIDHSLDSFESQVVQDLNRYPKKIDNYVSPGSQIQNLVIEEQLRREQELRVRQSLAQQFIDNARAGGYEVRLDENFNIVSVKKLRQPSQAQPNLFRGSGSSAK